MTRRRSRGRKVILDILYRLEIEGSPVEVALEDYQDRLDGKGMLEFAHHELDGIEKNRQELDRLIDKYAERWSLSRMPVIDRNILRIGLYEILHEPDIPYSVSINEAVELANKYSTEDSGRFINGVLGSMVKDFGEKTVEVDNCDNR